jgi:hypothetical protein
METSNLLPANAGLSARVVYVQSCEDCRLVVEALCLVWVANPSIGSFQCIASKKNHCCESGDALPRVTGAGQSEASKEVIGRFAARREPDPQMLLTETEDPDQLPISDTNGNLDPNALPNGFDVG